LSNFHNFPCAHAAENLRAINDANSQPHRS
jgi:hypothetical protein